MSLLNSSLARDFLWAEQDKAVAGGRSRRTLPGPGHAADLAKEKRTILCGSLQIHDQQASVVVRGADPQPSADRVDDGYATTGCPEAQLHGVQ